VIRAVLAIALLALGGPAVAQSWSEASFTTDSLSDASFWFSGEAPDPIYIYTSGMAFDGSGRMRTSFLADGAAVPSSAVFRGGIAHSQTGVRYVAAWPMDDVVTYLGGIAMRPDGAMIVATSGTAVAASGGLRFTSRGEVLVTEDDPEFTTGGLGTDASGNLSVTNSN
jgi:hypothetical protein